ncbi:MAG: hypothetical protein R3B70_03315 [Polyangiaceae bacterium]
MRLIRALCVVTLLLAGCHESIITGPEGEGGGGAGGASGGTCETEADCDDGDPCTADRCSVEGACAHSAIGNCEE